MRGTCISRRAPPERSAPPKWWRLGGMRLTRYVLVATDPGCLQDCLDFVRTLSYGTTCGGTAESDDKLFVPNTAKLATPLSTVTLMYPEVIF